MNRLSLLLFALLLLLILLTSSHYGIAWDEPVQHEYGQLALRFYRSGGQDTAALHFDNLYLYGAGFEVLAAWGQPLSPLGVYEFRHLLNALAGLLGILGCWKLSHFLAGPQAAFWSALILTLTPAYYGHMFNNSKDIPFAAGYIWSVYLILKFQARAPRIPVALILQLALAIGLTLSIRVGGLLLVGYLLLAAALPLANPLPPRPPHWPVLPALALVGLLAYGVMLLLWPWALMEPWLRPWQALVEINHFPWINQVLFEGHHTLSTRLPWYYLPHYFLIQLPELTLALLGLSLGKVLLARQRTAGLSRSRLFFTLGTAAVFPAGYAIASQATLYDGLRHFLFLFPVLTCLASLSLNHGLEWLTRRSRALAATGYTLLIGYLVWHVSLMVQLHPYQYIYFNQLTGGLPGAYGRYETDYWAHAYREAIEELNHYLLRRDGPVSAQARPYLLKICGPRGSVPLPPHFRLTDDFLAADFYLAFTRYNCHKRHKGRVILKIARLGTPLVYIKQLNRP